MRIAARVIFEDGTSGEIVATNWEWRGVLRDPDFVARAELDKQLRTLTWPRGAGRHRRLTA